MPERKLRIAHAPNPVFGICENCHARFTSFNTIPAEAERQVRTAFKEHKCVEMKPEPIDSWNTDKGGND
jgi:hypothetical protein